MKAFGIIDDKSAAVAAKTGVVVLADVNESDALNMLMALAHVGADLVRGFADGPPAQQQAALTAFLGSFEHCYNAGVDRDRHEQSAAGHA